MFESVEWMISTAGLGDRAHDAVHDAGRAAHAGADDRELRAVRAHAQREVEIAQLGAHARRRSPSSHTKNTPAALTLIMSIEMPRSASRSKIIAIEHRRDARRLSP